MLFRIQTFQLKIDGMDTSVASTKQAVIDDLIATAFDIEPRVHVNFRG